MGQMTIPKHQKGKIYIKILTEYDSDSVQDIMDKEVDDDNTSYRAGSSSASIPNVQEMHGNDEDPTLRIYAGDRKPASPMNLLLTESDIEPNCFVWKWEAR